VIYEEYTFELRALYPDRQARGTVFPLVCKIFVQLKAFSRLHDGWPGNFVNKTKTNLVLGGKIVFGQLIA